MNNNLKSIRSLTIISIMAVFSFILMYFRFPLPFAPAFYEMDFANIPTLLGGFILGPVAAILIELLRTILKLMFIPTSTFFIGELSGLLVNIALVLPAAMIYHKNKTFKNVCIALVVGVLCFTIVAALSNYYFIIPVYVNVMGFKLSSIIELGAAINSNVDSLFKLIIICTVPFNLFKGTINAIIILMIYKHISVLLKINDTE